MRILVSLILTVAVMAALVVGVVMAGAMLANSAGNAAAAGPVKSGLVPRVAFVLLWVLIFGVSLGVIGGA